MKFHHSALNIPYDLQLQDTKGKTCEDFQVGKSIIVHLKEDISGMFSK